MPSELELLQTDIFHRLKSEAAFTYVNVITSLPRDEAEAVMIQGDIDKALAGVTTTNGKAGLAVNVLMPDGEVPEPDSPGPQLEAVIHVQVLEQPLVNMGDSGTGIDAYQCVTNVLAALHNWNRGGMTLQADRRAVRELEMPGLIAFAVVFWQPLAAPRQNRTLAPSATIDAGSLTLTSEASAAIYFTTDGTAPAASNAAATLYAAPFAVTSGDVVRSAAFKAGKLGSAITEQRHHDHRPHDQHRTHRVP